MPDRVCVVMSYPAAAFLLGTVEHMNQAKILPTGDAAALQTSAWLEEIGAAAANAIESGRRECPVCRGSGEAIEVLTPNLDPRDPAWEGREVLCSCEGKGYVEVRHEGRATPEDVE